MISAFPRMRFSVFSCGFVAFLAVCLWQQATGQDLIKCYQCNVFSKGKQNVCTMEANQPESLIVSNCVACLKTFTFTSIHDRWFNQESLSHRFRRSTSYRSKYCLTDLESEHVKDEGCYEIQGPNGFTRQCYCHTNLCNASARLTSASILPIVLLCGLLSWTVSALV